MAGEWRTVTLGEIATWLSGGTPPRNQPRFWNGDIPWISAKSMGEPRLYDADEHLTAEGVANGSRMVERGAVLILVRGSMLHQRVPIGMAMRTMAFNQDVKALVPRPGVDPLFLLYSLLAREPQLFAMVEFTGIGAGKLDTQQLKSMRIGLPPLSEQRAIAHILGTLDDKIELLRGSWTSTR